MLYMRCSWIGLFVIFGILCLNLYLMSVYLINIEDNDTISRRTKSLQSKGDSLPTLYEHYTRGGIMSGLVPTPEGFLLNGRNITIFSGTIHYFRVHPRYWRDRLRKLRAAGFVAVETYVPWNLHEPEKNRFDYGDGHNEMSLFLDMEQYLKLAQEEDLLVLMRPGPYICAEWDFGGMPSWLLRDPHIKVRTSSEGFMKHVTSHFDKLLPILARHQFTVGGPIIAFQIENEYGAVAAEVAHPDEYLRGIKLLFEKHGLSKSMFYTSDMPSASGSSGALDGVLMTANFNSNPTEELTILAMLQPRKPLMVMEFWTGWFDHWFERHHIVPAVDYFAILKSIISFPSSVNLYMFHGGTNFGFMNGANVQAEFPSYQPDVTSYDYDALLSECGDYTEKYHITAQLVKQYNPVKTRLPQLPFPINKIAYPTVAISKQIDFNTLIGNVPEEDCVKSSNLVPMEWLDINNDNGQSYGFVLYRVENVKVRGSSVLRIKGKVRDHAMVLVDGHRETPELIKEDQLEGFGFWEKNDSSLTLSAHSTEPKRTLDILVENWGRVNYDHSLASFDQRKGLVDCSVFLDNELLSYWKIYALQFKSKWLNRLSGWGKVSAVSGPALYKAKLTIDTPSDTFINMSAWGKGNVFVNGFNIGRYFSGGPQRALYIPGPFLVAGTNEIVVFELFSPSARLVFSSEPNLG